jgi:hypothetical protein
MINLHRIYLIMTISKLLSNYKLYLVRVQRPDRTKAPVNQQMHLFYGKINGNLELDTDSFAYERLLVLSYLSPTKNVFVM